MTPLPAPTLRDVLKRLAELDPSRPWPDMGYWEYKIERRFVPAPWLLTELLKAIEAHGWDWTISKLGEEYGATIDNGWNGHDIPPVIGRGQTSTPTFALSLAYLAALEGQ